MILARLLALVLQHPWRLLAAVLAASATVLAGVGLMTSSGYLISAAALRPPILDLTVVFVAVRFFGISRAALRYLERLIAHDLTFKLLLELRVWFYRRLEPLAPACLTGLRSGDLLSRIVGDVERLQDIYLRVLAPLLVAILVSAAVGTALTWFDARLALVTLVFLALNGVGVPLTVRRLARGLGRRQVTLRAELNAFLVDQLQGVQDLLAFGRAAESARQLERLNRESELLQRRQATITGLQDSLSHLAAWTGLLVVLWLAIPLISQGQLDRVLLAVLAFGVLSSFEAVQNLGTAFQHLEASEASATRLFEIIDQPAAVLAPAKPRALPESNDVLFDDVHFNYGSRAVLQNIHFALPTGGKLAVVGASGSGKSTLIHLLVRFQDVARGRITLGGTDLRELDPEALRTRFAVVAQDAHLFHTTVRNNLKLAHPDATEPEMIAALAQAGLLELLGELPDGLDTWCEQGGSRFSGGQRRRLALAQALLKPAPILVLDEPLANLDGVQEQRLLDTLATVGQQRALLMVTHRLIRMEFWDQILVLQQGHIVERGTHRDLMRVQGLYRRMIRTQQGQLPSQY